jgi:hypothetical protein
VISTLAFAVSYPVHSGASAVVSGVSRCSPVETGLSTVRLPGCGRFRHGRRIPVHPSVERDGYGVTAGS